MREAERVPQFTLGYTRVWHTRLSIDFLKGGLHNENEFGMDKQRQEEIFRA
jgi:hypothetical protein